MSWTDQKPHVFTEKDASSNWGGTPGLWCAMCLHRMEVGDTYRWVYANGQTPAYGNFFVCEKCNTPDVLERYQEANAEMATEMALFRGDNGWPVATVARLLAKAR